MPQQLRVVDTQREHPIEIARRAVKEFRLDKDDPERPLPVSNQVHSGAPPLLTDEVIKRTEKAIVETNQKRPIKTRGYLFLALAMGAGAFIVLIIIAEALR